MTYIEKARIREEAKKLIEEGHSYEEIAIKYEKSISWARHCHSKTSYRSMQEALKRKKEEVKKLLEEGKSYQQIANRYEKTVEWVRRMHHECEIGPVEAATTHKERARIREEAKKLIEEGHSYQEVAKKYGKSIDWARNLTIKKGKYHLIPLVVKLQIIADLQNTRDSVNKLGRKYNLAHQTISYIFKQAKEAGILFPNRRKD